MQDQELASTQTEDSLAEQIQPYLNKWWWFVITVFLALSVAMVYLRYSTNIYRAEAKILIKDTQAGGGMSEIAALGDFGMLGNNFNSIANEMEVLSSKRLMARVVDELDLDVHYFTEGAVKTTESFQNTSFRVLRVANEEAATAPAQFYAQRVSASEIKYWKENPNSAKMVSIGTPLAISKDVSVVFMDVLGEAHTKQKSPVYSIQLSDFESTVSNYTNSLMVGQSVKQGSVIDLSITDPVPSRATAVLNQLIVEYNIDATNDKNQVAQNTVNFIQDRLATIEMSLDSVEIKKENFKETNNLSDIMAEASMNLGSSAEYTGRQLEAQTQLRIARDLRNYIAGIGINEYIPANLTMEGGGINQVINEYNELLLTYNQRTKTATDINPVVIELRQQLDKLKASINSSLNTYINSLELRLGSISSQKSRITGRLSEVPKTERTARDIERDQTIIEAIYLYLFQKKEEMAISLAVTAPKAKVVDSAWVSSQPVSPKRQTFYLAALVIGLLIPFAFIYLKGLFYNKIENRKDVLKKLSNTPFLGEIPKLSEDESDIIVKNDRSILAESFRILRTNLQYKIAALNLAGKAPVIIVTSTIKGEGKTFVSFNLAMTIANSGKRVLLLGGDIRNPQLHRYLTRGSKGLDGVTEFLVYPEYRPEEFIHESDVNPNLNVMMSGSIPPNPAELWLSPRVDELFDYGRENYDYVIIDSAPSMLVTDTLLISDKSDITMYVSRANYTEKPLLDFVRDTIESGKLQNVAMVLNDVKIANFGYGSKYSYSYGASEDTAWDRFLKAVKIKK